MNEDKEQSIWNEVKRRAQEDVRYGTMLIELKIQDGKIMGGSIKQQEIKLG